MRCLSAARAPPRDWVAHHASAGRRAMRKVTQVTTHAQPPERRFWILRADCRGVLHMHRTSRLVYCIRGEPNGGASAGHGVWRGWFDQRRLTLCRVCTERMAVPGMPRWRRPRHRLTLRGIVESRCLRARVPLAHLIGRSCRRLRHKYVERYSCRVAAVAYGSLVTAYAADANRVGSITTGSSQALSRRMGQPDAPVVPRLNSNRTLPVLVVVRASTGNRGVMWWRDERSALSLGSGRLPPVGRPPAPGTEPTGATAMNDSSLIVIRFCESPALAKRRQPVEVTFRYTVSIGCIRRTWPGQEATPTRTAVLTVWRRGRIPPADDDVDWLQAERGSPGPDAWSPHSDGAAALVRRSAICAAARESHRPRCSAIRARANRPERNKRENSRSTSASLNTSGTGHPARESSKAVLRYTSKRTANNYTNQTDAEFEPSCSEAWDEWTGYKSRSKFPPFVTFLSSCRPALVVGERHVAVVVERCKC
ncbi:hypothetical protein MRX96_031139 [Rhipicephalus microplus]